MNHLKSNQTNPMESGKTDRFEEQIARKTEKIAKKIKLPYSQKSAGKTKKMLRRRIPAPLWFAD